MNNTLIAKLFRSFESIAHREGETEYWLARELQVLLGYAEWRNFELVLERAREACANTGQGLIDHFVDVNKMVDLGSGAQRSVDDVVLSRYAAYLIAQNGDPRKQAIAFAQTYFAVQTRKQELIETRLAEVERLEARKRLAGSEKELSGVIFERLGEHESFARIRSQGDKALFGGLTTREMKKRLGAPEPRPIADFLPTITIKAKDFVNEITIHNTKERDLRTEPAIEGEHAKNNSEVRRTLGRRGIRPERLPPAEDVKKVERRLKSEAKKLPRHTRGIDKRTDDAL